MATKKATKKAAKKSTTPPSRRWSAKVKTDSTKPGPGLFKKGAKQIAAGMVSKKVSPEGPGQAMRMLNFYENRAGENLPAERRQTIERAKKLVHEKVVQQGGKKSAKKKSAAKKAPPKKSAKKA
jgi:tRNA(adenine34) deaminase